MPHSSRDSWQQQLQKAFSSASQLLEFLDLANCGLLTAEIAKRTSFRLQVPLSFARRMRKGDPSDPLLRQVLPLQVENLPVPAGYSDDPVGDSQAQEQPGLLHKYRGRILLMVSGACAVHCRYCFRRNYPYSETALSHGNEQLVMSYLSQHDDIREVILSGGDPLVLENRRLDRLLSGISAFPHVQRIRIHSRLPIVLPDRIDDGLLDALGNHRITPVMVIHCNHPQELDSEVSAALSRLRKQGISLLNQSVLLNAVNDDADILGSLSEKLFSCGVLPYYLHTLDKATGTAHFEVGDERALLLIQQLRERLSGYLIPRLVREEAGMPYKTPLI